MLDLVDEPDLLDRLSELDYGVFDREPVTYVPPPPLSDRLLIPVPGSDARWRSNWLDGTPAPHAAVASMELDSLSNLDNLDRGLLESSATADSIFAAAPRERVGRPRTHYLAYPRRREPSRPEAARSKFVWTLAMYLSVTMLGSALGAAGAALIFQDQLVAVMDRVDDARANGVMAFSLRPPRPASPPSARR